MIRIWLLPGPEISQLLGEEIIARYFYEDGAIEWTLRNDEQVKKAISILADKNMYSSILGGKIASIPSNNSKSVFAGIGRKEIMAGKKLI